MKILFSEKIWEQITSLWRDKKNVDLDIAGLSAEGLLCPTRKGSMMKVGLG